MYMYCRQYPLHRAAMLGKLDLTKKYIYEGMLADTLDYKNFTPLHYASFYGHYCVAKFLSTKCDLNTKTPDGRTAILLAALADHKCIVDLLIEAGADLYVVDDYHWSLLHMSCYKGWLDVVLEMIKYNKLLDLDGKTVDGFSPLWMATFLKHLGIFQVLVKSGADVRCTDAQGWTLLHCATRSGVIEMVKSVLSFPVIDFNAKTASGDTALFLAMYFHHRDIVELLVRSGVHVMYDKNKHVSIFHDACRRGFLQMVIACVEMGFDVHMTDYLGDTPLHVACTYGYSEIIEQLLHSGANCNIKNKRNRSPFNNLVKYVGKVELIDLCLNYGAYFQEYDVDSMYDLSMFNLEQRILGSVRMCTQSFVNEFNNKILPEVYQIPGCAEKLPSQEKLRITEKSSIVRNIRRFLSFEKRRDRDADLSDEPPIVLKILAAKALISYHVNIKRSAGSNFIDSEPKRKKALTPVHALEQFLDNRH